MTDDRERRVVGAFVELAESLASGYDAVDLLDGLVRSCVAVLDVTAGGLLLGDGLGQLHVLAASSQGARDLQVFQAQGEEGPCRDCYRTGAAVDAPDLAAATERWPHFARRALDAGFASAHAVPLRLRTDTLGALGLFGSTPGALGDRDRVLAQALADVAGVALVQEHAAADQEAVVTQLRTALSSRIDVEQAKGVLAHAGGMEVGPAFHALRRYARDHNLRLTDVAADVVARRLPVERVLRHTRTGGSR